MFLHLFTLKYIFAQKIGFEKSVVLSRFFILISYFVMSVKYDKGFSFRNTIQCNNGKVWEQGREGPKSNLNVNEYLNDISIFYLISGYCYFLHHHFTKTNRKNIIGPCLYSLHSIWKCS